MPSDLPAIIGHLFPNAVIGRDFEVRDDKDGRGLAIVKWDTGRLGTQPTEEAIHSAAAAAQAETTATKDRLRQAKQFLRSFDPANATAAQVRTATGAIALIIKHMLSDD